MKRAVVLLFLLSSVGVLFAQTAQQIPCQVVAGGGGHINSLTHGGFVTLGQPAVGYSSSASQGLRHGFVPCSMTATSAPPGELPSYAPAFQLHQNVPNPFNPRTAIAYEVPASGGHVRIRVYDLGGRLVRTLLDEQQSPGRHTVIWNGVDDGGRTVASGLYLYRLEAPAASFTRKMTLVR